MTFLCSRTSLDFEYLSQKLGIENMATLKSRLRKHVESVDLKKLADDVRPFLIRPDQVERILRFEEFIETL